MNSDTGLLPLPVNEHLMAVASIQAGLYWALKLYAEQNHMNLSPSTENRYM